MPIQALPSPPNDDSETPPQQPDGSSQGTPSPNGPEPTSPPSQTSSSLEGSLPQHDPSSPLPPPPPPPVKETFLSRIKDLFHLLKDSFSLSLASLNRWYYKALALALLAASLLSAVLNLALVPIVNSRVMPAAALRASEVLQRSVILGEVKRASLLGITGTVPLLSLGPLFVGEGPVEASRLYLPEARVFVDPFRSLVRRQVSLRVHLESPEVLLVQSNNYGWMGFPDDSTPLSSRDFLPGLKPGSNTRDGPSSPPSSSLPPSPDGNSSTGGEEGGLSQVADSLYERWASQYSTSTSTSTAAPVSSHLPWASMHLSLSSPLSQPTYDRLSSDGPGSHFESSLERWASETLNRLLDSYLPSISDLSLGLNPSNNASVLASDSQISFRGNHEEGLSQFRGNQAEEGDDVEEEEEDHDPNGASRSAPTAPGPDPTLISLGAITMSSGKLGVLVRGDPGPRWFEGVEGRMDLARGFMDLDLVVDADPHSRPVDHARVTLINPSAKRHLRHVCERSTSKAAGVNSLIGSLKGSLNDQRMFGCDNLPRGSLKEKVSRSSENERWYLTKGTRVIQRSFGLLTPATFPPVPLSPQDDDSINEEGDTPTTRSTVGGGESLGSRVWSGLPSPPWLPCEAMTRGLPTGGHVRVVLKGRGLGASTSGPNPPDLLVTVRGENLDAPLIERLVELTFDIHEGRVGGEIRIKAKDKASWHFPEISGLVRCQGLSLHIWDASDEIMDADMDIVLERDRVYFHGARGRFGWVPLRLTGDMDLNPETGSYRLSVTVPSVEANALRYTLGIRPVAQPLISSLRGVMHVTGPLEKPVFSGSVVALRPSPSTLDAMDLNSNSNSVQGRDSNDALDALLSSPNAVGAWDKVPILSASGIFTLDTSSEKFTLHSCQVQPLGGGQLMASGTMWVAPRAEGDPSAISMRADASDVDPDALMKLYLTPTSPTLPEQIRLGPSTLGLTMTGSHLSPEVKVSFKGEGRPDSDQPEPPSLPQPSQPLLHPGGGSGSGLDYSGSAFFSQRRIEASLDHGPSFRLKAGVSVDVPHLDLARRAEGQAEATYYSKPRFQGCDVEASLGPLDLMPLLSQGQSLEQASGGPPSRARVSISSLKARLKPTSIEIHPSSSPPLPAPLFNGEISLKGVKFNQLDLVKGVSGSLSLSGSRVSLKASGDPTQAPPDEEGQALELDLSVPDLSTLLNLTPKPLWSSRVAPVNQRDTEEGDATDARPLVAGGSQEVMGDDGDSSFALQCGALSLSADVERGGREVHGWVRGMALDDFELGSLRGVVNEASFGAEMGLNHGRVAMDVQGLKYENLMSDSFKTSVRWEGDVIKLEETVLVQKNSKYELQGELFVNHPSYEQPPPMPSSEALAGQASPSPSPASASSQGTAWRPQDSPFRWQLRVAVPNADLQDILPAAQLLESRKSLAGGRGYVEAKNDFLSSLPSSSLSLPLSPGHDLDEHNGLVFNLTDPNYVHTLDPYSVRIKRLQTKAKGRAGASGKNKAKGAKGVKGPDPSISTPTPLLLSPGSGLRLGLQDLQGSWGGKIVANGNSTGSSEVDFDLRGLNWKCGQYKLDGLVASGSLLVPPPPSALTPDSIHNKGDDADTQSVVGHKAKEWEGGLQLTELSVTSGPARLLVQGTLLCPEQEAKVTVTDFPLALLRPLFEASSGLDPSASPSMPGMNGGRGGGEGWREGMVGQGLVTVSRPLQALGRKIEASLQSLGLPSGPISLNPLGPAPPSGQLTNQGSGQDLTQTLRDPDLQQGGSIKGSRGGGEGQGEDDGMGSTGGGEGLLQGHLFLEGELSGSLSAPQASVKARVERGALGKTRLKRTEGSITLDASQLATALFDVEPLDMPGHLRVRGTAQVPKLRRGVGWAGSASQEREGDRSVDPLSPLSPSLQGEDRLVDEAMDIRLNIKDGGMSLLCSLAPECEWKGGQANMDLRLHGQYNDPKVLGQATISRGRISSPLLRSPLTNLNAAVRFDGQRLVAEHLSGEVGRNGRVKASGSLPLKPSLVDHEDEGEGGELTLEAHGLEMRVKGSYSGAMDARVNLKGSLASMRAGGWCRFSKGTLSLIPPSSSSSSSTLGPTPYRSSQGPQPTFLPASSRPHPIGSHGDVRHVFSLLKAGRRRVVSAPHHISHRNLKERQKAEASTPTHPNLAHTLTSPLSPEMPHPPPQATSVTAEPPTNPLSSSSSSSSSAAAAAAAKTPPGQPHAALISSQLTPEGSFPPASHSPQPLSSNPPVPLDPLSSSTTAHGTELDGFQVMLGPDLRAFFPVVLTTQVKGLVSLSGPLTDPTLLTAHGEVGLESGTLNLVATQFTLDRDHDNRILFSNAGSEPGSQAIGILDPMIDLVWVSGDLRATVKGRSSAWQESFSLSASGTPLPSSSASPAASAQSSSNPSERASRGQASDSMSRADQGKDPEPTAASSEPHLVLETYQSIPVMGHMGSTGSNSSMEPSEVARVFEERLAEALVGDNGQLALKSLATSTFSTLLPKLETRGQFGAARWRLVGAPYSLPNLLRVIDPISSPDGSGGVGGSIKGLNAPPSLLNPPSSSSRMDPYRLISSLAAGTELELEVGSGRGRSFKARVVVHTGGATEATATYRIGERVRLQFSLARVSKLMLQYNSTD